MPSNITGRNNTINVNTFSAGTATTISSSNNSQSSVSVKITQGTNAKTILADTDVFLLEESDGTIKHITGSHIKSNVDTNHFTLNNNLLYPTNTSDNLIVGATSTNLSNQKLYVNGNTQISGIIYAYGQVDGRGYINFYNAQKTNHLSLYPPSNMVGSGYNVILPNDGSTLATTSLNETLTNKTLSTNSVWNGTTISVAYGGTGLTTITKGNILYANNANTIAGLPLGTSNQFLRANTTTGLPAWNDGYAFATPLSINNNIVAMKGLTTFGSNHQVIGTNGTDTLEYKTITAGTGISIANSSSAITISSTITDTSFWNRNNTIGSYDINTTSQVDNIELHNGQLLMNANDNTKYFQFTGTNVVSTHNSFIANNVVSSNYEIGSTGKFQNSTSLYLQFLSSSSTFHIEYPTTTVKQGMNICNANNPTTDFISFRNNHLYVNYNLLEIKQDGKFANGSAPSTDYIQFQDQKLYVNYLRIAMKQDSYIANASADDIRLRFKSNMLEYKGALQSVNGAIYVGNDNSTIHLDVGVNHAVGSSNGSSYFTCYYNGTQIGDVRQATTSSVNYETTSDYRLKTNVEDFTNGLDVLNKLKVKKFNYKTDLDINCVGFIAHELQEADDVFHFVVSGVKDDEQMYCNNCKKFNCVCSEKDCMCKPYYQSIDYGKLTPYTIGAIQDLYSIIQAQQEQINTMKSTIDKLNNSATYKQFKS